MYQVIIIEDDPMVAAIDKQYVEADSQFRVVRTFKSGGEALAHLPELKADLIILDYYAPGMNGTEFVDQLHTLGESPFIIAVTSANDTHIVQGLLARGVLDYLVKPFSFQELEARIKALLRRNKETAANQLTCDNLVLDCNIRRAKRGDVDIDLTVKEYRLLEYFMTHQGVALSRITLLKDVWDKNFDTNTNIVDVYVNYLRVKIDRDFDKKLIHTVVGLGYIMNA